MYLWRLWDREIISIIIILSLLMPYFWLQWQLKKSVHKDMGNEVFLSLLQSFNDLSGAYHFNPPEIWW